MRDEAETQGDDPEARSGEDRASPSGRPLRADARRNIDALVEAARAVFATLGVDAPIREVADRAGVGVGTLYRHFPQRADLVAAVFRREVDACADAAPLLSADHGPGEALARWMARYADFLATKRGLAASLHSGDAAFAALPAYFMERLQPALGTLLEAAADAGEARAGLDPENLLRAIASLCAPAYAGGHDEAQRMVALFVNGLRHDAARSGTHSPDMKGCRA